MGKNTQIFLLGLVFVISGAAGYLIEDAFWGDVNKQIEEVQETVQPEVVLSPVPVVEVTEVTKMASGKYEFTATASTESGDTELKYVLYGDAECTKEIIGNYDGKFIDVPAVESQTYYLKVWNIRADIWSELISVTGFAVPQVYRIPNPLTRDQVQTIINNYSSASKADINNKIVPSCPIILQNGLRAGERALSHISEIDMKLKHNLWKSVEVVHIDYDGVGKVNKIVINVTYP